MSISLSKALEKVERLFPSEEILNKKTSTKEIARLYAQNGFFYKWLHSYADSMHMTFKESHPYSKKTHDGQLLRISALLDSHGATNTKDYRVLELGCGKGYNLKKLAIQYPDIHFTGIDLVPEYITLAKKKLHTLDNVEVFCMDIDRIDFDTRFDLVFDIETLCHLNKHEAVLQSIYNLLRPNGQFVLFDVFRKDHYPSQTKDINKALDYIELAVGIPNGISTKDWISIAKEQKFDLEKEEDFSHLVLPGLKRYHRMSSIYFGSELLAKAINKVIPEKMQLYAIASYLMKYSMEQGFQSYSELVLRKRL